MQNKDGRPTIQKCEGPPQGVPQLVVAVLLQTKPKICLTHILADIPFRFTPSLQDILHSLPLAEFPRTVLTCPKVNVTTLHKAAYVATILLSKHPLSTPQPLICQ